MTKPRSAPNRPKPSSKKKTLLKVLIVSALAAALFPFVVGQAMLPQKIKTNPLVNAYYQIHEHAFSRLSPKQAEIKPEKSSEQGYSQKDRLKLDTLISTEVGEKK